MRRLRGGVRLDRREVQVEVRRPRLLAPGDARVITAADVDDLWPKLQPRLTPDAAILLKASRGVKLERLVPILTTWAGA